MNQHRWACTIFGAVALSACGGNEAGDGSGSAIARWSLQRVVTIDPSADSLFDHITTVIADARGEIYVSTEGSAGIHVYDSLGKPLRVLGLPGSGPGEFRRKYSIAWAGDTIGVYDPGNGRVEFIDRYGHWVASHPTARASGDRFYLYPAGTGSFFAPRLVPSTDGNIETLLVRDGFHIAADTIVPPKNMISEAYTVYCRGGGFTWWSSPDAPTLQYGISPDGILVTWRTDQYRVTFMRDTVALRNISFSQLAVPIPDSAWAAQLEEFRNWRQQHGAADCTTADPRRPETVPLLLAVVFDDQGRAWIEGMQHDTMMLAVYDTSGTQIAAIPAPERDLDVPYVIRGDQLYEVEADEDGLQKVVVYRVIH